jgi:hypothetical protein
MSANTLTHTTRRFVMDRLERLVESLENLSHRLRETLANLVGTHIGDAIRDALEALLHQQPTSHLPDYHRRLDQEGRRRDYRYDYPEDDYDDQRFWYGQEPLPPEPPPEPEPGQKSSRWKSLLTGLVHLSSWFLHQPSKHHSWPWVLGIGTVGITTLLFNPILGGVVVLVGAAALFRRLADRARNAADRMASLSSR